MEKENLQQVLEDLANDLQVTPYSQASRAKEFIDRVIAAHERSLWRPVSEPPTGEVRYFITDRGVLYFEQMGGFWLNTKGAVKKPTIWRELPTPPEEL